MVDKINFANPVVGSTPWGVNLNDTLTAIKSSIGDITSVAVTTADVTLSTAEGRNLALSVNSGGQSITAGSKLFLPSGAVGFWVVKNASNSGGADLAIYNNVANDYVSLKAGATYLIYSDGTNVYLVDNNSLAKSGGTMTGALALPANGLNVGSGQLQVTGGDVTSSGNFSGVNITASGTVTGATLSGALGGSNITNATIGATKLSGAQTGSAPIFGVRAWANVNGSGTGSPSLIASGNISSVSRTSALYTLTFTTAMPNENYAVVATQFSSGGNNFIRAQEFTTASFKVKTLNSSGGDSDSDFTVIVVG